jgi:hypothetical protein
VKPLNLLLIEADGALQNGGGRVHYACGGNFHNKENQAKRPKKLIEPPIHSKEQIMENQTKNTAFAEEKTDKQQYQTFNPKAALPSNAPDADAERKWQLVSLLAGILLIAAIAAIGWLYRETSATETLRGQLDVENQSLREQLNLAGTQIAGLKNEMETLRNRNIEPANENPNSKSQTVSPVAAVASRRSASVDTSRINVTRKGTNSSGTTRDELIGALGEPDRVYTARGYEQLVYFGKKPGRFWLIGEHVVQIGG